MDRPLDRFGYPRWRTVGVRHWTLHAIITRLRLRLRLDLRLRLNWTFCGLGDTRRRTIRMRHWPLHPIVARLRLRQRLGGRDNRWLLLHALHPGLRLNLRRRLLHLRLHRRRLRAFHASIGLSGRGYIPLIGTAEAANLTIHGSLRRGLLLHVRRSSRYLPDHRPHGRRGLCPKPLNVGRSERLTRILLQRLPALCKRNGRRGRSRFAHHLSRHHRVRRPGGVRIYTPHNTVPAGRNLSGPDHLCRAHCVSLHRHCRLRY